MCITLSRTWSISVPLLPVTSSIPYLSAFPFSCFSGLMTFTFWKQNRGLYCAYIPTFISRGLSSNIYAKQCNQSWQWLWDISQRKAAAGLSAPPLFVHSSPYLITPSGRGFVPSFSPLGIPRGKVGLRQRAPHQLLLCGSRGRPAWVAAPKACNAPGKRGEGGAAREPELQGVERSQGKS